MQTCPHHYTVSKGMTFYLKFSIRKINFHIKIAFWEYVDICTTVENMWRFNLNDRKYIANI